jgi:predicted transglutaminase-like cysteine proteinase
MRTRLLLFSLFVLTLFSALASWDYDRLRAQIARQYGSNAERIFVDWQTTLGTASSLSESEKLNRINTFFNRRLRYEEDQKVWNSADYWATPLEFIGRGEGDCEDFVIAKYFSLRQLGVSTQKLRLTYVSAKIGGSASRVSQAHMVLTYYATPDAEPLVLDSLIGSILPASRRPDLTPVYSFNSDGFFVGNSVAPIERLSRWKDLLVKMKSEGMEP